MTVISYVRLGYVIVDPGLGVWTDAVYETKKAARAALLRFYPDRPDFISGFNIARGRLTVSVDMVETPLEIEDVEMERSE
jgi:hypothetical protein